jgi:hypothetical protein
MNELERKELIKKFERVLLYSHLTNKIPPEYFRLAQSLKKIGVDPEEIIEQAFYKFEMLSLLLQIGEALPTVYESLSTSLHEVYNFENKEKEESIPTGNLISFTVVGDSMIGAGIEDGDVVLAEKSHFSNNSIYIVKIADSYFVKRVELFQNGYLLHSENKRYKSVYIDNTFDIEFVGKVKYVVKRIERD